MTPEERKLISDLFDRLDQYDTGPRDPQAEALINQRLGAAPKSAYAMAQTIVVQNEALKRVDARIQELQAALAEAKAEAETARSDAERARAETATPVGGFARSGVPAAGRSPWGGAPMGQPSGFGQQQGGFGQPGGYGQPVPPQAPQPQPSRFGGGGFLAGAAQAALGVAGGMMLADGIRSLFGGASDPMGAVAEAAPAVQETVNETVNEVVEQAPDNVVDAVDTGDSGGDGGGFFGGLFGGGGGDDGSDGGSDDGWI